MDMLSGKVHWMRKPKRTRQIIRKAKKRLQPGTCWTAICRRLLKDGGFLNQLMDYRLLKMEIETTRLVRGSVEPETSLKAWGGGWPRMPFPRSSSQQPRPLVFQTVAGEDIWGEIQKHITAWEIWKKKHDSGYNYHRLWTIWIIHQQFWGYKVLE
jgi:hypothetical protein